MNTVALRFASGEVFFAGVLVCVVAILCLGLAGHAILRASLRVCVLVGIALVAASGTPLAWWHYAAWTGLVVGLLLGKERRQSVVECGGGVPLRDGDTASASRRSGGASRQPIGRTVLLASALAYSLILVALEAPYRRAPEITVAGSTRQLHVIGDSLAMLSFDAQAEDRSWPQLLGDAIGLELIPTTAGGATLASALRDAEPYLGPEQLVLIETRSGSMRLAIWPQRAYSWRAIRPTLCSAGMLLHVGERVERAGKQKRRRG